MQHTSTILSKTQMAQFSAQREPKDITEEAQPSNHNFTVAVRIKPKEHHEENVKIIINKNSKEMSIQTSKLVRNNYSGGKCRNFKMDAIFEEKTTNESIFAKVVKEKLALLKRNRNVALMAYGATNSGKTYTILGSNGKQQGLAHISYRHLMEELFQSNFRFYFSYLEIYNENIQDLLCVQQKRHNLNLFEDYSGKVNIPELTRVEVSTYEELCQLIDMGSQSRAESSNNVNKQSSRSHAILQLEIFSVQDGENEVIQMPIEANFMIIDLAGSEKSSPYFQESQQVTVKEGSNINRSLLALGNCIKNLANGESHIPYRNSKLTRLLKENLSGSCHNIMIACINHTALQYQESISTLQYASKACRIEMAENMSKGRNRTKFLAIPCEHCKMSLDYAYISKGLKQFAFQVTDLLNDAPASNNAQFANKVLTDHQKQVQSYINKLKNVCKSSQQIEYLAKILDNIDNSQPKVEINIEQTDDSHREQLRMLDQNRISKLRLKEKGNNSDDKSHDVTGNVSVLSSRQSNPKSERSVRLRLKEPSSKQLNKQLIQAQSSYIKIEAEEQPKSLNISSINSRREENGPPHYDHYIQPFLPELSFDISEYYSKQNPKVEKDFEKIQFAKKRSSEPRPRFYSKENNQNTANINIIVESIPKTDRDRSQEKAHNSIFFAENKALRRMKQDVISTPDCPKGAFSKELPRQLSEKQLRNKIKLIARVR